MTNQEIFQYLKQCRYLTYSTYHEGEVYSRIAGILTADDDGIYFFTLRNKPYARQLFETKHISICGFCEPPTEPHPDYIMRPGYTIRVMGDVREVDREEVKRKAPNNAAFQKLIDYDFARYPDTVCFCLYQGKGEIYDYDFNLEKRDHKLERTRFAIGQGRYNEAGFRITDRCIACGQCISTCHYDAITKGTPYKINSNRCDECGNCYNICPMNAIEIPNIF